MTNQNEYFKTIFKVRRNLIADLIQRFEGETPDAKQRKAKLEGKLEAFNEVLSEIETYEFQVFEATNPNVKVNPPKPATPTV